MERYFTLSEIAEMLHVSYHLARELFRHEDGVIRISHPRKGVQQHITYRIPQSVVERKTEELSRAS